MTPRLINKKESAVAIKRAQSIIQTLHTKLKKKYIFDHKLVGSAKNGTIVSDSNGEFDVDYQLLLTHNSKIYRSNGKEFKEPTRIKGDFKGVIQALINKSTEELKDSTTSLELISKDVNQRIKWHIDFVIIDSTTKPNRIVRRNNTKENPTINSYTWNPLRDRSEAYDYFSSLEVNIQEQILTKIVQKKIIEKKKDKDDPTLISSSDIFIQEVMRYKNEH